MITKQRAFSTSLASVLATLVACGGVSPDASPDASTAPDGAAPDSPAPPDGGTTCEPGYQDLDGDGTCQLTCEGTGANDNLNCGGSGTCEIDATGTRGCVCAEGAEGAFCDTCSTGYELVNGACVLDLPPTTNLSLWLDADSAASLTLSGTAVTAWADRRMTGATPTVAQNLATARPSHVADGRQGRGVVRFDGVDDALFVTSYAGLSASDYEIIVAFESLATTTPNAILSAYSGTLGAVMLNQHAGEDYQLIHRNPPGTSGGVSVVGDRTSALAAGWVAASHQSSGTTDTLAIFASDGTTFATGASNITPSAGIGEDLTLRVGRSNVGYLAGDLYEVLIYTRRLSVAERKQVTDYLGAKWKL